jgi:hypothetical protein
MNTRIPTTGLAVVLLGVAAVGAAGFGLVAPVLGFLGADLLGGSLGTAAQVVLILVGALSLAFGASAAFAARALLAGRRAGATIGLAIGAVLVAAPAVASVSGGWHPALVVSTALGSALVVTLASVLAAGSRERRG